MTKVIKRDGREVEFDESKIELAILNAMAEINYPSDDIQDIVENIVEQIENEEVDFITVEEVQEIVVGELYAEDRNLGKVYNDYRNKQNINRQNRITYTLLTDEFLSKYKHLSDPFPTDMSTFVFYRTYSRFLPKENRRERWWETVARVVEYNCSLAPTSKEEAEKLYDNMFNLRQFPSGRSLYVGGTEVSRKYVMSNFNCAFNIIDNFDCYSDSFYLLLIGAGVGFRVLPEDVAKLPKLRTDIEVIDGYYQGISKGQRKELTEYVIQNNILRLIIGDSKEGWVQALNLFLKIHYDNFFTPIDTILIDYDNIRPAGERLKTFGGYASGHQSMKIMINKISKVIKNCTNKTNDRYCKLKPIDCMDIANIIGENVVSGGVRRTAELILFDVEDKEILTSKNNLYTMTNGKWEANKEIIHRSMSNNSIFYKEKPTREQLHWQINQMRFNGEPAFANYQAISKRDKTRKGGNPCFTGDMKLLTEEGYKTFDELNGNQVNIININGEISKGKVWCNGEKETIKLTLSNKKEIICTPNHVFMTLEEQECEAKDLKGKKIMPYISNHKIFDDEYVKYGFIQGDGDLGRLDSDAHKGLEVNIGDKDQDILFLFRNNTYTQTGKRKIYLQGGYKEKLINLGFDSDVLPTRKFPSTYDDWTNLQKASFLQGCFSANGGVIKGHRISYKATSFNFIKKLSDSLNKDFGISNYITTNKSKLVKFKNGEYQCKESYDLNISKYEDLQKFHHEISFYHLYKKIALRNLLLYKAPYIMNIKQNGIKKVYDFSEPITHWGCVEGFIVHNCFEILLDNKGMCNLVEIVLPKFIENGQLNKEKLFEAQRLSARASYRMTCVDYELHEWDLVNKNDRLIGCSLTGWQDMVNILSMSKEEQSELLQQLKKEAITASDKLADELHQNRPLLHTTIKPSGTISLLPNVSAGIHYSHSKYYIRRIRMNASDPIAYALKDMGYNWYPEVGQNKETCTTIVVEFPMQAPKGKTKYNVSAIEQLENYKMFMNNYVEHNVSITVTVRDNEWEEVEQWMWDNWDDVVAVSFLPLSDAMYQLMPYEEITEEQYLELCRKTPKFNPSIISKYEKGEDFEITSSECEGGFCPIR